MKPWIAAASLHSHTPLERKCNWYDHHPLSILGKVKEAVSIDWLSEYVSKLLLGLVDMYLILISPDLLNDIYTRLQKWIFDCHMLCPGCEFQWFFHCNYRLVVFMREHIKPLRIWIKLMSQRISIAQDTSIFQEAYACKIRYDWLHACSFRSGKSRQKCKLYREASRIIFITTPHK